MTSQEDQLLLLVDNNDVFSGKYAKKKLCHAGKGLHHRAFVIVLENKKGEILLQKRKHERWSNIWDISGTSHVLHLKDRDETYEDATIRCLDNELGIKNILLSTICGRGDQVTR